MLPRSTPFLLAALAGYASAQTSVPAGPPKTGPSIGAGDLVQILAGEVRDLARDAQGRIVYCTAGGTVGRFSGTGPVEVLATGFFPFPLRAVAETLDGSLAVVDQFGDVRLVPANGGTAVRVHDNDLMIQDPTDLIVDGRGNFLIASATPSNGLRGINWVSSDGFRWGYYLVRHSPVQLAHDPLTNGVLIADANNGGNLQLVAAGNPLRPTSALDAVTHPGTSSALDDGTMALEADGDVYWCASGNVWKRSRAGGTTTLFASGFGVLRGSAIAASTPLRASATGWSLYVAEGANPTLVHELPGVDAPGAVIAADQGFVPGPGVKLNLTLGFQCYELTADASGRLLLGGSQFGSTHFVKRVTLSPTPSIATVASSANGLSGLVEGIVVAPDASLYCLTRPGPIQRITEGPLSVTTVFSDPTNAITAGKDLVRDVNGDFYVANRDAWGLGKVLKISGGVASLLVNANEARGLAATPGGGMYVSEWNGPGFQGTVDRYRFSDGVLEVQPGFSGINFTNDSVWGDGDLCVDAAGGVYSISEDDWSLVRYAPNQDGFARIGSGYLNHPSGLVIAPSTAGSGSTTGWSLYVSEFDFLYERASVQAPASTSVDASLGLMAGLGRALVAGLDPRYGQPRTLAPAPSGAGLLVATSQGWLLALDPESQELTPVAGPEQGLTGDLVALATLPPGSPGGMRVAVANRAGELFGLSGTRVFRLAARPERLAPVLERFLAAPRRWVRLGREDYVLDGWAVWRVTSS